MVLAAGYQWFVSQFQPGNHPTAPDSRSAFASLSNYLARCYAVAAINDIRITPKAAEYRTRVRRTKATNLAINAETTVGIAVALDAAAAGQMAGNYMEAQQLNHTAQLNKTWDEPGVKMVCLNDDIDDLYAPVRPLINPTVVEFLESRYPTPSQYELPPGRTNVCR